MLQPQAPHNLETITTWNPMELVQNFNNALIFLQLIQRADLKEHQPLSLTNGKESKPKKTPWHRYLDELCHLCQFHGAEAVVAIAVGMTQGYRARNNEIWLGLCHGDTKIVMEHLRFILRELDTVSSSREAVRDQRVEEVTNRIAEESIRNSGGRVGHYYHILRYAYSNVSGVIRSDEDGDEDQLSKALAQLDKTSNVYVELCRLAHHFRCSNAHASLLRTIEENPSNQEWNQIRHAIGRLGSWHKAARFLTKNARKFSHIFRGHVVKMMPRPEQPKRENKLDLNMNLQELLQAVCPLLKDTNVAETAFQRMQNAAKLLGTWQAHKPKPTVHAEAALLHYLAGKRFAFVNNDRYIGCSKPACYCCSLYFSLFPDIVARPTHGRAWMRWWVPGFPIATGASVDETTLTVIRQMTETIEKKVEGHITRNEYASKRLFDSTTGMSVTTLRKIMKSMGLT